MILEDPEKQGLLAQWLQPIFDKIGLSGAEGVNRSRTPAKEKPPILTDEALRKMGYSEEDIRAVRAMGRK